MKTKSQNFTSCIFFHTSLKVYMRSNVDVHSKRTLKLKNASSLSKIKRTLKILFFLKMRWYGPKFTILWKRVRIFFKVCCLSAKVLQILQKTFACFCVDLTYYLYTNDNMQRINYYRYLYKAIKVINSYFSLKCISKDTKKKKDL